jgi:hypothetical protein
VRVSIDSGELIRFFVDHGEHIREMLESGQPTGIRPTWRRR